MCFLPLKSSHYPSRPVPVPELFGKYPTRPVPKSKTPTRQTLLWTRRRGACTYFAQLPTTKISHLIAIIITLYDINQARCRQRTEPRLHVERPYALFAGGDVGHP